jgi:RND family efflux transporter MFP subunit
MAQLVIAAAIGGCDSDDANVFAPPPPPEVIVATPLVRDVVDYLTYTGVIEASETVELRARVQGFLESVNFQPGQRVKTGDILFVIDKSQYQNMVDQAEAAVRSQEAALIGAENDATMARDLADQRAGPEIDAVIKAAKRDSIKADLAQAQAELAEARLNLEYCDVIAPIDGRVTENYVDVGNLVGRSETTLLAKIVQATPAYVPIDASESDVLAVRRAREQSGAAATVEPGQIAPGQWRPCELALADETDYKVAGQVDYVDPALNPDTGTLRVRTRFENANETLLPGLFARIRFPMSSQQAMLVPDAALLSDQRGRFAMVVNAEDTVEVRRVSIGVLDGSMRVVTEGLEPDDRVIVLGVLKARPGAKVNPKMQEAAESR